MCERGSRREPLCSMNGTSTSTVPEMCTSGVLVVLLLHARKSETRAAVDDDEQRARDEEADDEPPMKAEARGVEERAHALGP